MKTKPLYLTVALAAIFLITISFVKSSTETWQKLFNGKDLTGWHQLGGIATFEVVDGVILGTTVKGTPNSFLRTDKEYGDFVLEADVKVDENLNSGIQFRSHSIPEFQNGRVHGYQIEVDEAVGGFSGRIWDEGRRRVWLDNLKDTAGVKAAFKVGEWNTLRVTALGSKIKTEVNGFTVAEITDTLSKKGFIALQVHGAKESGRQVRFKNLRILEK